MAKISGWLSEVLEGAGLTKIPDATSIHGLPLDVAQDICHAAGDPELSRAVEQREDCLMTVRASLSGVRSLKRRQEVTERLIRMAEENPEISPSAMQAALRDFEAEAGKRGRKPRELYARTPKERAKESRERKKAELRDALFWMYSRLSEDDQKTWKNLYPDVAKKM